jgi:hypothetical protein
MRSRISGSRGPRWAPARPCAIAVPAISNSASGSMKKIGRFIVPLLHVRREIDA